MRLTDRSDWGAGPPESSPTPWDVKQLDGICQHWFGSPKAADTHAGCDDLLRSVQRTHQAGEYNDIAYNIGVCPHGEAYELRGGRVRGRVQAWRCRESDHARVYHGVGVPRPCCQKMVGVGRLEAAREGCFVDCVVRGVRRQQG